MVTPCGTLSKRHTKPDKIDGNFKPTKKRGCMRVFKLLLILTLACPPLRFAQARPPARVVISKITQQTVAQNRSFIGTLYYDRISHVSSEVSGLVTRIDTRAGDLVKKGTPIIFLDTEILEKEILLHKNQIEQADLYIRHSKKNFQRMDSLYKNGGIREKDYDDARFVYQDALLKKMSAQTILEKLMIQKRKSIITAPFDGSVLEKNVDIGDWVHQGKQLIRIGSVNDLFVRVPVAETLLKFISVGQTVPVNIHAYDKKMTGTIENLSPIADAKTKNIFIKIRIPILTQVAQNMSATVYLSTGIQQTLAILPRDALVKVQGRDVVYTIEKETAVLLPVNIVAYLGKVVGADNAHFKAGMPVIVDGNDRLRPGQAIVIDGEQ